MPDVLIRKLENGNVELHCHSERLRADLIAAMGEGVDFSPAEYEPDLAAFIVGELQYQGYTVQPYSTLN